MQSKYHSRKAVRHFNKVMKSYTSINHHVTSSFNHFPILFWCISEFIFTPEKANQRGFWRLKTLLTVDTAIWEVQPLRLGELAPRFSLGGMDCAAQYHIQQLLFWNWPSKTSEIKNLLLQGCKDKIIWKSQKCIGFNISKRRGKMVFVEGWL